MFLWKIVTQGFVCIQCTSHTPPHLPSHPQGDYAFENHVLSITKCEVHTFDCTYKGEDQGPRHHYHEWCLGSEPDASMKGKGKFMTYKDIVVELGHVGMEVEVLKIDIEGYEFQTMSGLHEFTPSLPKQVSALDLLSFQAVAAAVLRYLHSLNLTRCSDATERLI